MATWSLDYGDTILTAGSCFAQSMGDTFASNKFKSLVNPFGTTYHPLSLDRLLGYALQGAYPSSESYLIRDEQFFNFDFHSSFSAPSRPELEELVHDRINRVGEWLRGCRVLILTYGTAWQYTRDATGSPVANCHKLPSTEFSRKLISAKDIIGSFEATHRALRKLNPEIRVILTVSPVRHLKDSLEQNSVSKAVLRVAAHHLEQSLQGVEYFPAFELMIDDLRDYRFYADDLLHPTPFAEEYIWQKFGARYFSDDTHALLSEWAQIRHALAHRPFHPESTTHLAFLRNTLSQLEQIKGKMDVKKEIADLAHKLQSLSLS
jgi:hypothetical protein